MDTTLFIISHYNDLKLTCQKEEADVLTVDDNIFVTFDIHVVLVKFVYLNSNEVCFIYETSNWFQ